jgi:PKD repeat protein
MRQDSLRRAKYPELGTLEDFEIRLNKTIRDIPSISNGRTKAIITIPIVVHIVHNGEAVGNGTNISRAQVESQIEVLNEDFRRKTGTRGFNDSPVGADIEFEFCLSPIGENGETLPEPGIHRYHGGKVSWTENEIETDLKPSTIWNPNLFYNVWVLNFGGTSGSLLGYAQFPSPPHPSGIPSDGGANTDGVVCQYSSFGSSDKGEFLVLQAPYDKGRTLTHETGHWLGLRHIWGDGPCATDYVDDTPTAHGKNSGCPINRLSCDNVTLEMVQNYMDYTDNACMNIFTKGQKARMVAVMELSPRRKSLIEANICSNIAPAPPVANFSADRTFVLKGGEVAFTDLSSNFPTQWKWTFEGGNPNTSLVRNPKIKYASAGVYKVRLEATNSLGTSDPLEIEGYIIVSPEGVCGKTTNFADTLTSTVLKLSQFGSYTGYAFGHNSEKIKAFSDYYANQLGYRFLSGVEIHFAKAYAKTEDATAIITVWNARGVQNGPGSIIERKEILIKQIIEDINAGRPTIAIFDRETPVFSRAYHVGIELSYAGDSLAVYSAANNEPKTPTPWVQSQAGVWTPYATAYGINTVLRITPLVGMSPSVQVAASKLLVNPGEEVILNARGASIFSWSSTDNAVQQVAGPQIIVRPVQTTIYETKGSGLELCDSTTHTTIFVKGSITGADHAASKPVIFPNPGQKYLHVSFTDPSRGPVEISLSNIHGSIVYVSRFNKIGEHFEVKTETENLPPGLYIISIHANGRTTYVKWIKSQ